MCTCILLTERHRVVIAAGGKVPRASERWRLEVEYESTVVVGLFLKKLNKKANLYKKSWNPQSEGLSKRTLHSKLDFSSCKKSHEGADCEIAKEILINFQSMGKGQLTLQIIKQSSAILINISLKQIKRNRRWKHNYITAITLDISSRQKRNDYKFKFLDVYKLFTMKTVPHNRELTLKLWSYTSHYKNFHKCI